MNQLESAAHVILTVAQSPLQPMLLTPGSNTHHIYSVGRHRQQFEWALFTHIGIYSKLM